ncbi:MAG: AAA family ATPase [Deltaproteobacteria bacterium]|nr:AAA family ATPase [Deltaproteobacteria bacterium]
MKKIDFIVEQVIPENMLTLLLGRPGSFKSWVMVEIAVQSATGYELFGQFSCQKCSVIYIDEDTPQNLYEQRLEFVALGQVPSCIDQQPMTGFRLVDDTQRNDLCSKISTWQSQGKKVLVLIDCLAKVSVGLNLDKTQDASKVMAYLAQIRDAGATVVVAHHVSIHRQGREPMNNTQIKAGTDSIIEVEALRLQNRSIFNVTPVSKRVLLTEPFSVEIIGDNATWANMSVLDDLPVLPTDDERLLFQLFPDYAQQWTVKQISDSTGKDLPDNRIRDALSQLVKQQCLEKVINPHDRSHAAYYRRHPGFNQLKTIYRQNL